MPDPYNNHHWSNSVPLQVSIYLSVLSVEIFIIRFTSICWSDGRLNQHQPRLLYGTTCNAILVSHVYKCFNDHYVSSSPSKTQSNMESLIPFALWHISGFTQPLMGLIEQLIQSGMSLLLIMIYSGLNVELLCNSV